MIEPSSCKHNFFLFLIEFGVLLLPTQALPFAWLFLYIVGAILLFSSPFPHPPSPHHFTSIRRLCFECTLKNLDFNRLHSYDLCIVYLIPKLQFHCYPVCQVPHSSRLQSFLFWLIVHFGFSKQFRWYFNDLNACFRFSQFIFSVFFFSSIRPYFVCSVCFHKLFRIGFLYYNIECALVCCCYSIVHWTVKLVNFMNGKRFGATVGKLFMTLSRFPTKKMLEMIEQENRKSSDAAPVNCVGKWKKKKKTKRIAWVSWKIYTWGGKKKHEFSNLIDLQFGNA